MTLKILIMLDFNPQQPRSLIHILGLQYFYLGSILLEPFDSFWALRFFYRRQPLRHCLRTPRRKKTYHVETKSKLDLKSTSEMIKSYLKVNMESLNHYYRVGLLREISWIFSPFFLSFSSFFSRLFFFFCVSWIIWLIISQPFFF